MRRPLPRVLEGKGRPIRKERRYLTVCRQNTADTDRTFFRFGPPSNPRASKYLNFLRLMQETGRAMTYWDLHQLCTGILPDEVGSPVDKWGSETIRREYNESVKAMCRYGYLRRLAYGRRYPPRTRGRPRALFSITEKGRDSLRRFEGMYSPSPYYADTYNRIMAEKRAIYEGVDVPPPRRVVEPMGPVFNAEWIWANKERAESIGIILKPWRV